MSVVLRAPHLLLGFLVVGSADRHPVADVVAADDGSAGMDTGVADVALQTPFPPILTLIPFLSKSRDLSW